MEAVRRRGGDVSDETEVLSDYVLQFGAFRGQTFRWILENGLGYAAWLVDNMRNETVTGAPLSQNKASFKAYAMALRKADKPLTKSGRNEKQKSQLYVHQQLVPGQAQ